MYFVFLKSCSFHEKMFRSYNFVPANVFVSKCNVFHSTVGFHQILTFTAVNSDVH